MQASSSDHNHAANDSKVISLFEIRFGQSIIIFILMCIIVLACRNLSHRIGLSIVVAFLIGGSWFAFLRSFICLKIC